MRYKYRAKREGADSTKEVSVGHDHPIFAAAIVVARSRRSDLKQPVVVRVWKKGGDESVFVATLNAAKKELTIKLKDPFE